MNRREIISLLGGAVAWPGAAGAQSMPVIGYLSSLSPELVADRVAGFRQGLQEAGFVEGTNAHIEYRWANGQYDRLPELAADLVRGQAAVIAVDGAAMPVIRALATTIPIVFFVGNDPVQAGFVASLSRPGGNITGVTSLGEELLAKRLELLHVLLPTATVVAAFINPTNPSAESESKDLQTTARTLGLQMHVLHVKTERDLQMAFADVVQLHAGALVIGPDPFLISRSEQLAALALGYGVPTIFVYREFATAGGLMTYGGSLKDMHRQLGFYAGRILKGEKPADLPVQRATKVELIINLKTAKTLGITVPLALLTRADEVIE
jgi:putative tryptophan/tyrosine transport system substrate-binding protein